MSVSFLVAVLTGHWSEAGTYGSTAPQLAGSSSAASWPHLCRWIVKSLRELYSYDWSAALLFCSPAIRRCSFTGRCSCPVTAPGAKGRGDDRQPKYGGRTVFGRAEEFLRVGAGEDDSVRLPLRTTAPGLFATAHIGPAPAQPASCRPWFRRSQSEPECAHTDPSRSERCFQPFVE